MHIAYIITRGNALGGATVHVRDLARNLIEAGDRATVLIGGAGEASDEIGRAGVPVRLIPHLRRAIHPLHDALALAEIVRALRDLKPDLVSTHTAKSGWLGRIASRITGCPALFTPHGWSISDRVSRHTGFIYRIAERAAAPLASSIVNVCEAERRLAHLHRISGLEKLVVIHNGVRDVAPALRADPARQPPRLVMVARFEDPKDHASLLRALAPLRSFGWTLDLIGSGPKEPLMRRLADSLGLAGRVRFAGPSSDIAAVLAAAQIFVLASRSEGFPRSILEAMRAGLPVIASDVGGVAEAVRDGETGFVVPANDAGALTSALERLLARPELRLGFGAAGRRSYELNFTFERMSAKTIALYETVLRRPAKAHAQPEGAYGVH